MTELVCVFCPEEHWPIYSSNMALEFNRLMKS